ncbi:NADH-quinone oxidoreductase subunit NuoH [Thermoflavimicrobium daqui]|jgi:NADH-quinone oxidoreductase subunit H|uniref:NADH-quinone oxidoreductase subunit H n=1 Tax=Thermoflavimicrobium daqui TaxID=2137476 RepID=A0A364K5D7_9BACL|nr:NADH-quinone oxidoreductase subunit NuoH [Thermoflavimicrobium daqui]RAL24598.1 NADH-quinone oxidoreductase subunit NuoH [Thermoflavimicrobium daqui]
MDIWVILGPVIMLFLVLGFVTYAILFERKVIGWIQNRVGPTQVGPWGLLQTVADVLKLLIKEDIIPRKADVGLFKLAPVLAFIPAFAVIAVIPFTESIKFADIAVGLLYYMSISSITIIGVLLGGWASNNKYSLLGGMRSAAQMVSYEIPLVLSVVGVIMSAGSLNLTEIVHAQQTGAWFIFPQFLGFIVFLIASIAELNRTPFDLPEAESELVAGYHTEYTGFRFAFFMLTEYTYIFGMASLITILYLGGWDAPFGLTFIPPLIWFILKFSLFVFFLFWLRATMPRIRGDQLMEFAWKGLLPLAIFNIFLTAILKEVSFLSHYF